MFMVFVTGDAHAQFDHIVNFCKKHMTSDDILIMLGDVGLNYYLGKKDKKNKELLQGLNRNILMIHGNHECRPENIETYTGIENDMGRFLYEPNYPNLLFCIDGEEYLIEGKIYLALGGAYSVDKYYRLSRGYNWWADEQMDENTKQRIRVNSFGKNYDYIIAHTCPYKYVPTEMFLANVDQSTVDNSMEEFLNECEKNIGYKQYYCGHYHTNKSIDKIRFLYNDIIEVT